MADALADLLREIENMRKERGELRTKNAALEAELTKTKAELAVIKFDLDKIRERNVKHVLALNALQKSAGAAVEKIRNSDAVRYYTRFHCADELKQIAVDLEAVVKGGKEK